MDQLFDFLPDEMVVEVFRFLDPKYLLRTVKYCNRRFEKLIDSEYLYQHHHFKYLIEDEVTQKIENISWKAHTIENYINKYRLMMPEVFKDKVDITKEHGYKRAIIGKKYNDSKYCNWSRESTLYFSDAIDSKESHEWVFHLISKTPTPCNFWLTLICENDSKEFFQGKNSFGAMDYLFQFDTMTLYSLWGGGSNVKFECEKKAGSIPAYFVKSEDVPPYTIEMKIVIRNMKFELSTMRGKVDAYGHCTLVTKEDLDHQVLIGIPSITLRALKEVRLVSYKKGSL